MSEQQEKGPVPGSTAPSSARWSTRLAGVGLIVLGVGNIALGLIGLTTDQIRLSTGVLGGLVVLGATVVSLGVLVRRGSRLALAAALLVFSALLVVQVGGLQSPADPGGQSAVPSVVVLLFVVATLGAAQLSGRRDRS